MTKIEQMDIYKNEIKDSLLKYFETAGLGEDERDQVMDEIDGSIEETLYYSDIDISKLWEDEF